MSITEKLTSSKNALASLLDYANAKTEKNDPDIGEAIRTLVDGYGGGGGGNIETGTFNAVSGSRFHEVAHSLGRAPDFAIMYPIDVTITSANAIMSELILNRLGQLNYSQGGTRTDYEIHNDPFAIYFGTGYALNSYVGNPKSNASGNAGLALSDAYVRFGSIAGAASGGHLEAGIYGYIIGII